MRKRHSVTKNEIASFNAKRMEMLGKTFSREELVQLLKRMGYSAHSLMVSAFTSGVNPPIICVQRGQYVFNPKPVHISRLQKAWDDYRAANTSHMSTQDEVHLHYKIENAISLLKENGYVILKSQLEIV